VLAQLALGALVRHMGAGLAIPDFPLAFGKLVPPLVTPYITVHFAHRLGALAVTAAVLATTGLVLRRHRRERVLVVPAALALALLALQLGLGAAIIWTRRAVVPTSVHVVCGAALLATCLVLTLRSARAGARRLAAPAAGLAPGDAVAA
jgi:cytochrome c oxidase assembly protein subunit 15